MAENEKLTEDLLKLTGSIEPYQRKAYEYAQFLKQYVDNGAKSIVEGKTPFEDWCTFDIDDMIISTKVDMDNDEAEWIQDGKEHKRTDEDKAHYCRVYLLKWFILMNLQLLKDEHGWFKHCVDMIEPVGTEHKEEDSDDEEEVLLSSDPDFLSDIIVKIADYAVKNKCESVDDTLRDIAEDILIMLKLGTFDGWVPSKTESNG